MKLSIALIIAFGMTIPTAAASKSAASQNPPAALDKALKVMAPAAAPPGQTKKKPEHDQGDENASDRAKERVCTKNTPAAQRSAICPRPNSPT